MSDRYPYDSLKCSSSIIEINVIMSYRYPYDSFVNNVNHRINYIVVASVIDQDFFITKKIHIFSSIDKWIHQK